MIWAPMVDMKEITLEQFQRMGIRRTAVSSNGQQALEILKRLRPDRPVLIKGASRGLQVSLSRRIGKAFRDVEMRVDKKGKNRNIALLKKG